MRSGGVSRPPAVSEEEDADWGQASNGPPSYWQDSEDVEVELLDNSEDTKRPNGKKSLKHIIISVCSSPELIITSLEMTKIDELFIR